MTAGQPAVKGIGPAAVAEFAVRLRADSIRYSTSAGSGHPTSSMSAADVIAMLVSRYHLRYHWDNRGDEVNDHLILAATGTAADGRGGHRRGAHWASTRRTSRRQPAGYSRRDDRMGGTVTRPPRRRRDGCRTRPQCRRVPRVAEFT